MFGQRDQSLFESSQSAAVEPLDGNGLHKICGAQATAQACRTAGGKNVIRPRGIISGGHGAVGAQKDRAGGLDASQQCRRPLEEREMFGSQAIDQFRGLRQVPGDDDGSLGGKRLGPPAANPIAPTIPRAAA